MSSQWFLNVPSAPCVQAWLLFPVAGLCNSFVGILWVWCHPVLWVMWAAGALGPCLLSGMGCLAADSLAQGGH